MKRGSVVRLVRTVLPCTVSTASITWLYLPFGVCIFRWHSKVLCNSTPLLGHGGEGNNKYLLYSTVPTVPT